MIGRIARTGVLFATLAALTGTLWLETPALQAVSDTREVSRVRAYVIGEGPDPEFPVAAGDRLVRLVTNAIVPEELGGADVDYAIQVDVVRPGAPVEPRVVHLRSHRSGPLTGSPDPCFDASGTPIADSRNVDLAFDPPAEPGARLVVRPVEGQLPVLLRAWSSQPRAAAEKAQRLLALYPELRDRLEQTIGVGAWDHLRPAERTALTENRFARLAASGSLGADYAVHDFWIRPAVRFVDEVPPTPVDLTRRATWLLRGPAPVEVRMALPAGGVPGTITLRRLSMEVEELATFTIDAEHPSATWTGSWPEGVHTLEASSTGGVRWELEVTAPGTASVPPADRSAPLVVPPSVTRIRAASVGPQRPVTFDAEGPADPNVRTLEIEVWGRADRDPTLTLRTIGDGAEEVELVSPVLAPNDHDAWVDVDGSLHAVRGPARVKLLLPPNARELVVSSDQEALVRFRVPFHEAEPRADAAGPAVVRQIGVREGPAERSWVRVVGAEEVEVRVAGRIEPVPLPPPPPPTWVAATLSASGFVPRAEVLEKAGPIVTGRAWTEVADRPVTVRASVTGRASARWRYEVQDRDVLGAIVPLSLDGAVVGELRLALMRGTYAMPPLEPGDHVVSAVAPAGVRLFVDVPPVSAAATYKIRTVAELGRGYVDVPVRVRPGAPRGVDLVVYHPSPDAVDDVTVDVVFDGGSPRRRQRGAYTRSTPPEREFTLPAASRPDTARLLDGDGGVIGYPRTLWFPLGDDLEPGWHTLRVRASRPIYARFFVLAPPSWAPNPSTALEDP